MVSVFIARSDGFPFVPAPGVKVLRASQYQQLVAAEKIWNETLAKAEAFQETKEKEAAALEKAAKEMGYSEGRQDAQREQAAEFGRIAARGERYLLEIEDKLVNLIMDAVTHVLGQLDEKELVSRLVRNALAVLQRQNRVSIHVKPDSVEHLRQQLDAFRAPYPSMRILELHPDETLEENSCILKSPAGIVRISLEDSIAVLRRAVAQVFATHKKTLSQDLRNLEYAVLREAGE